MTSPIVLHGATAVITHRVRPERVEDYEHWAEEIVPLLRRAPGYLDRHRVLPVPGLTETYTIILRFDTAAHLKHWMTSPARTEWIEKVKPFLVTGNDFFIRSGLDFWFTPEKANAAVPTRWKQFLVSWSAVIPLSYTIPLFVRPLLESIGLGGKPSGDDRLRDGRPDFPVDLWGDAALHAAREALAVFVRPEPHEVRI
jgi:antibiotic biosynthesis monooxygenase (ABM) superfamily enzyme